MPSPFPEPKPGSRPNTTSTTAGPLSFNERHALREASTLAPQLYNGQGSKKGEFVEIVGRANEVSDSLTVQLRPVTPLEVSGSREQVSRALDGLETSETPVPSAGSSPERYNFSGYPVIALVTEGAGPEGTTLMGLRVGFFEGQDATVRLETPRGQKPVIESLLLGPTSGTAAIDGRTPFEATSPTSIKSHDGKLTALLSRDGSGNISIAFEGDASIGELPVWFAFVDPSDGKVLSAIRSDGGRGQGSLTLGSDGQSTQFDRTFSIPAQARLVFIIGRAEE